MRLIEEIYCPGEGLAPWSLNIDKNLLTVGLFLPYLDKAMRRF
jgi:hypothetical protein